MTSAYSASPVLRHGLGEHCSPVRVTHHPHLAVREEDEDEDEEEEQDEVEVEVEVEVEWTLTHYPPLLARWLLSCSWRSRLETRRRQRQSPETRTLDTRRSLETRRRWRSKLRRRRRRRVGKRECRTRSMRPTRRKPLLFLTTLSKCSNFEHVISFWS